MSAMTTAASNARALHGLVVLPENSAILPYPCSRTADQVTAWFKHTERPGTLGAANV